MSHPFDILTLDNDSRLVRYSEYQLVSFTGK